MRILANCLKPNAMLAALMASACSTTSLPANVDGVKGVVKLDTLAGAQGKNLSDQAKIDATMARGCRAGVASKAACSRHTRLSDERRLELEGGGQ